jgi:PTS system mannose-specific IIA component
VETGKGVLLLTDMFGGTPSNLAISFLGAYENLEVIAGVNMPMLVKLAKVRSTHTLEEASLAAQEAARSYINVASRLLGTGS